MHYRNILLAVSFVCAAGSVNAQDADIIIQLKGDSVESTQRPSPTFVLTREAINQSGYKTLSAAINALPFTQIRGDSVGDGTTGVIDIRGFGETASSSVRVLLNDIPLNNPTNEAPNFSFIPLSAVESIEVTPAGGLEFGPGTVGGVINIRTLSPVIAEFDGVEAQVGSYGRVRSSTFGTRTLSDQLALGYTIAHQRSDGYRHHSDVEQSFGSLNMQYAIDPQRSWSVTLTGSDENRLATGAATDESLQIDRRAVGSSVSILDIDNTLLTTQYRIRSPNGNDFRVKAHHRLSRQIAIFDYGPNGTFEEASDQATRVTGYSAQSTFGLTSALTAAVELSAENSAYEKVSNFSGFLSSADRKRDQMGASTKFVYRPSQGKSETVLGIRVDEMNDTNQADGTRLDYRGTSAEASQQFTVAPGWTVQARATRAIRYPTFDENEFTVSGEPLSTQKSSHYELVTRSREWLATLYQIDIRDEIRYIDPTNFLNGSYPKTTRYGLDIERRLKLADTLTAHLTYGYLHTEIVEGDDVGSEIPALPNHSVTAVFGWQSSDRWNHQLTADYLSSAFALNDPGNTLGKHNAYLVTRLETTYRQGGIRLTGTINNLLNTDYDLYRIATASLDAVRRTPAEPRSIEVSLRYEF